MKEYKLLLLLILSSVSLVFAQNKFEKGKDTIEVGNNTYEVRESKRYPIIGVSNLTKNIKNVPQPKNDSDMFTIQEGDLFVDTVKARVIVYEVLKEKLETLQSNKDYIAITYVFYPNGNMMNINFILPTTTLIAPLEIDKIDLRLRKEIKASLKGIHYKDFPVIFYNTKGRIYF